jgi:hypothetical protein
LAPFTVLTVFPFVHLIVFTTVDALADGVGDGATSFGFSWVNLILIVGELNENPYAAR